MIHLISDPHRVLRGDLAARSGLLAARLEKKEYRPKTILTMDQAGWPGDWEGRTILALVRLAESTKKEPAYLHDIVDTVLCARNERGYLGHILPDGEADEQQLSGHSWLLRGLIAYYGYTGREDILTAVRQIGRNLYLPLKDAYPLYPVRPEQRVYGGGESGNVAGVVGRWHISTDTGCAYMPLDGLTALYALTKDPDLGDMLRVMIENFLKIDFTGICMQTHATLTGTRGILRFYEATGEKQYLAAAERLFSLYTQHGMTANYANYNWFGRPEWTEPCAVIDSFLVALQLYRHTGERSYITYAQRIYYNGMGFGQRENGGFGCDCCVGAPQNGKSIRMHNPEAYWCCTMRGGEGLASAAEYAVLTEPETDTILLPVFTASETDVTLSCGRLRLCEKTSYPYEGHAELQFRDCRISGPVSVRAYLPDGAADVTVTGADAAVRDGMLYLTVTEQTAEVQIDFSMPLCAEHPEGLHNTAEGQLILRGNLILSLDTEEESRISAQTLIRSAAALGDGRFSAEGLILHPLYDAYEEGHGARQILFL